MYFLYQTLLSCIRKLTVKNRKLERGAEFQTMIRLAI